MDLAVLTVNQISRLANILDGAGQVVLATVALPYLLGMGGRWEAFKAVSGGVWVAILWWLALRSERLAGGRWMVLAAMFVVIMVYAVRVEKKGKWSAES